METPDILDQHFRRERTPEENSEFHLLRLDAAQAAHRIQYGRYALYFVCAFFLIVDGIRFFEHGSKNVISLFIDGGIYGGLAWISFKYPKTAFGLAVGIYLLASLINVIDNPLFFRNIIFDIIIVYCLITAFKGSIQMDIIKKRADVLSVNEKELLDEI